MFPVGRPRAELREQGGQLQPHPRSCVIYKLAAHVPKLHRSLRLWTGGSGPVEPGWGDSPADVRPRHTGKTPRADTVNTVQEVNPRPVILLPITVVMCPQNTPSCPMCPHRSARHTRPLRLFALGADDLKTFVKTHRTHAAPRVRDVRGCVCERRGGQREGARSWLSSWPLPRFGFYVTSVR